MYLACGELFLIHITYLDFRYLVLGNGLIGYTDLVGLISAWPEEMSIIGSPQFLCSDETDDTDDEVHCNAMRNHRGE